MKGIPLQMPGQVKEITSSPIIKASMITEVNKPIVPLQKPTQPPQPPLQPQPPQGGFRSGPRDRATPRSGLRISTCMHVGVMKAAGLVQ